MNITFSEKMYKFLIVAANDKLPFILPDIMKSGSLHIEKRTKPEFSDIAKLEETLKFFEKEFDTKFPREEKLMSFEELNKKLTSDEIKYRLFMESRERLNRRAAIINNYTAFFEMYPQTPEVLSEKQLFFTIPLEHVTLMNEYIDKYGLLGTYEEFKDSAVYFLITLERTSRNIIYDIVKELNGNHFFEMVKFKPGADLFEALENKKWGLLEGMRNFNLRVKHFVEKIKEDMPHFKFNVSFYREVDKFKAGVFEGDYVSIFSGWIPESKSTDFKKILTDHNLYYEFYEEEKGNASIPVRFSPSSILGPFNMLVAQYGNPRYGYFNPVIIFAVIYCFLFGFMFGDLGHGSVLMTFGILMLFSPNYKKFASLMLFLGGSSMIFGLLFGSLFGNEEVMKPLLFRPYHQLYFILFGAIAAGVIVNILGALLNIFQKFIKKDIYEMFFDEWGIIALVFYLQLIVIPLLIWRGILPKGFGVKLLIFLTVGELMVKVFFNVRREGLEKGLTQGVLVFIWFIEFLSNTVSFIRVAAFLLAHVALSSASFLIIEGMELKGFSAIVLLVFWNIFVILLEGLVVFIQSMRLTFYEFFSKFFTADGANYDPLKI